jgi:acetolactate synthase I/II/III large subunit
LDPDEPPRRLGKETLMGTTAADALAVGLRRHGVEDIFGQSMPSRALLAAEARGIRQIGYRTEHAGGAMADGYARSSGRVGVVGAQNGPAAALLVAPLAEALKASAPVVALVQDIPRAYRDRNAFQELDHRALFAPVAKWVREVDDATRIEDYVDAAFTQAASGRPGPAVLLLPKDLLSEEVELDGRRTASLGRAPLDRVRPDTAPIRRAAELLAGAESPVVVAGGGVHLSGGAAELAELQATASLPVATTVMGKGAVDETHPLSTGVIGQLAMGHRGRTEHLRPWLASADVVLLVGTRTNENGTGAWELLPRDATYIHVDVDGGEIGRTYEALRLVGDAKLTLRDLVSELRVGDLSKRRDRAALVAEAIGDALARHADDAEDVLTADSPPMRPERVMRELDRLLTPDTIVVADASYATIWVAAYLWARRPGQRFLAPRGLAGIGWGLPMALGAKAANPRAPVVCVTGDGGFGHVWAELETAVRERLPVVVVVLDNGILGYQKHAELAQFDAHTSAVELRTVDHAAIARACGADGMRVETPDELAPALAQALTTGRATVVDVATDPDAYPPIVGWDDDVVFAAGAARSR